MARSHEAQGRDAFRAREACGLTQAKATERYSKLSADIFECHHKTPLATVIDSRKTRQSDLAVVCPTCHRALHGCADADGRATAGPTGGGVRMVYAWGRPA